MGYSSFKTNISNLLNQKNVIVLIKPRVVELNEVVISNKKPLNAYEMVKKAFETCGDNYIKHPYYAKGFIRHSEKDDKQLLIASVVVSFLLFY